MGTRLFQIDNGIFLSLPLIYSCILFSHNSCQNIVAALVLYIVFLMLNITSAFCDSKIESDVGPSLL